MNYYNNIKQELLNNEINKKVKEYSINKSDLTTYYNVGKMLTLAGKHYGEGIIKEYSKRLTSELGKGYTETRLKYYRQFYVFVLKCPTMSDKLNFSHYCEIIWFNDINKINYYIKLVETQNLSVRKLREKIKSNEYERLPESTRNKLINKEESNILDYVKDPIIIKNNNYEEVSEKTLQKLILEDISSFLEELGEGYSFMKNEFPIKIGNTYNYIDLLLFNVKYNCYVVVELKVTELKKEHIGQIEVYMNYINKNIKTINQNKTVGIIMTKINNKNIIKYSSDERIIARTYELT